MVDIGSWLCQNLAMVLQTSRGRLPSDVADQVRIAARVAREQKELTNAQIAVHLGWGVRRVVDMLAAGRPLRLENARGLLLGLIEIRPQNAEASEVLDKALRLVGSSVPPVFIPPEELDRLAEYLADELSRLPGVGPIRRNAFERDVRYAMGRTVEGMEKAFYSECRPRSESEPAGGEL